MKSELQGDLERRLTLVSALLLLLLAGVPAAWSSRWRIDDNYIQINQHTGQQYAVKGIVQVNTPVIASNAPKMMITGFTSPGDDIDPDTLTVWEAAKTAVGSWLRVPLWTFDPDECYALPRPPTFVQAESRKFAFWADREDLGDVLLYSYGDRDRRGLHVWSPNPLSLHPWEEDCYIRSTTADGYWSHIYVAWLYFTDQYTRDEFSVHFRTTATEGGPDGTNWAVEQTVVPWTEHQIAYPSIASAGSHVYIFWLQATEAGSCSLWCAVSHNYGASGSFTLEPIRDGVDSTWAISAVAYNNNVYVTYRETGQQNSDRPWIAWSSDTASNWNDSYRVLIDHLASWSRDVKPLHLSEFQDPYHWNGQTLVLVGPVVARNGGNVVTYVAITTAYWRTGHGYISNRSQDWFGEANCDSDTASCSVDWDESTDPHSFRLRTVRLAGEQNLYYRGATYGPPPRLPSKPSDFQVMSGGKTATRGMSDGRTHLVSVGQEADTFIFYRRIPCDTAGWFPMEAGTAPAMAMHSNLVWICYVRHDSILAKVQASDTTWRDITVYSGSGTNRPGAPSLAVFQSSSGRLGNVAFPVYHSGGTPVSQVLFCQFGTLGVVVLDTVSEFSGAFADSCVSVSVGVTDTIAACWSRADTVEESHIIYGPTDNNRPGAWSGAVAVNQAGTMRAYYPSTEVFDGRLYVSWLGKPRVSAGLDTFVVQRCSRALSSTTFEGLEDLSDRNTTARGYYPSISTDEVAVWSESLAGGKWQVVALVRDSLVALTSPDSVCKFCAVAAETAIASSPSTSTIKLSYLFYTKLAGDTWEARYASKDVKVSNADANVSKYNNGRKLLIDDNDQLAAVWRSNVGAVYYSERDDDPAAGWTNHSVTLVNSDVPCLDRDYLGINWVACRSGSSRKIDGAYSTGNPSSWTVQTVYDCGQYNQTHTKCGPPSIAACRSDPNSQNHTACYFAFTTFREDHDSSFVVFVKTNASGTVIDCDTLDRATPRTDSFASISIRGTQNGDYISVAWQRDNDIFYRVTTSAIDPASTSAISWSNTYNLSNTQAVSRHPQVCCASDSLVVAWAEGSTPAVVAKRQSAGSAYNSWGSQTAVSYATDTCCDYPTISLGDSTIIAYHKMVDTLTSDIWVNINFQSDAAHNLNITNSPTPSKYPHVAFEMHDGTTPVIHTVWTEVLTPNYHEMGYRRWDLTQSGGGGEMSADVYDASIEPELASPRPNPFGHSTTISYAVNRAGNTTLKVFDLSGRTVRTLADGRQKPGRYSCTWNRQDDQGRKLPEGVYFVRLKSPNFEKTRKAVITE